MLPFREPVCEMSSIHQRRKTILTCRASLDEGLSSCSGKPKVKLKWLEIHVFICYMSCVSLKIVIPKMTASKRLDLMLSTWSRDGDWDCVCLCQYFIYLKENNLSIFWELLFPFKFTRLTTHNKHRTIAAAISRYHSNSNLPNILSGVNITK